MEKKVYELVTLLTCMVNILNTNPTRRAIKMNFLWRFVVPGVYECVMNDFTQSFYLR